MIMSYPILADLSEKTGTYRTNDAGFALELRKNGHQFLLSTEGCPGPSQLYGIIGVAGKSLVLYASMGTPNLLTFTWPHALDETHPSPTICFNECGGNLSIRLAFTDDASLAFQVSAGDQSGATYLLQRT